MRRFFFRVLAGVAALLLLAACGSDGDTAAAEGDNTAATSTADDGPTSIVEGSGIHRLGSSDPYTLEISATEEDGEVSGSGSLTQGGVEQTFTVQCNAEEGDVFMVGATFDLGERAGEAVAFLIKDLNPDRLTFWFEEKPAKEGCDSMLANIPADVLSNDEFFQPLEEGDFSFGA